MDGVLVEINFGGEPFVILLAEEGGDEAQEGGVGKREATRRRRAGRSAMRSYNWIAVALVS